MDVDLVISGGEVVDGTGAQRFRADVGIVDGRIVAVTESGDIRAQASLDATGLIVAPGFVDIHSHIDWALPLEDQEEALAPILLQGITTALAGNCGMSVAPVTEESIPLVMGWLPETIDFRWRSWLEFLDTTERAGLLLNAAFLVGHGAIRATVMGKDSGAPEERQLDAMCRGTREALRAGAFGLSAGLEYVPGIFASDSELLSFLRVVAEEGGLYAVHSRCYSWVSPAYRPMVLGTPHNIRSVRDQMSLARAAGVPIQLSHLIFEGRRTWRTCHTVLRDIDLAAEDGLDVAFDAFPYTFGPTTIDVFLPPWFLERFSDCIIDPRALRRAKWEITMRLWLEGRKYDDIVLMYGIASELEEFKGMDFTAIAHSLHMSEASAYVHVTRLSEGNAHIQLGAYSGDARSEEPLRAVLSHPLCAFMSDPLMLRQGCRNRADYGAFPRVLGRYARDLGLFSLEEAVRRMTSFPAQRIGLTDVGRIAEGLWADIVVFDPEKVTDNTTRECPDAPPTGIEAVLISGQVVAHHGEFVGGPRRGRLLRR
jgi:N-acyl-D-amino-acid deacylase